MPYGEKGRLFHSSSKKRENIKPKRRREKNDKRLRGKNVNVYAINGVRESPTEIAMALINCLIDPAHISCLCVGNDTTISSFFFLSSTKRLQGSLPQGNLDGVITQRLSSPSLRMFRLEESFRKKRNDFLREKQREKVCTVEKGIMNAVGFTRCCRPSPLKEKLNTSDHETAVNPHTHKHIRATTDLPGHR